MKIWKNMVLFYLGGSAYMALEVLWRGHSHGSMFLAGGACFLLLGKLSSLSPALRGIFGAGAITLVELGTGLLCNRSFGVWDYRSQPGNFLGQICPLYTVLWIPVALAGAALYRLCDGFLNARMSEKKTPGSGRSQGQSVFYLRKS